MKSSHKFILIVLFIAFFFSGASALIYQVLWVKHLTLIFGSQTLAISTILASFMGGLSLGSYLMSRYASRIKKVVLTYAYIEILIGIYALLIPLIFELIDVIYKYIWPLIDGNYTIISLVRFLLVFIVLIIPTSMMGATLPLIVKYYIDKDEVIVRYTSLLYGINTFGAVVGTFISGFYLIEHFGMRGTNFIAISFNIIAAIVAILVHIKTYKSINVKDTADSLCLKYKDLNTHDKIILWCMLISGFTALAYEVIWARQLVLIFGSTTYSYSAMLFIFLTGVAFGSISINRFFNDNNKNRYYFAGIEILTGLLVIAGIYYYKELIYLYSRLATLLPPEWFIVPVLVVSALLILPATFAFGVLFPLSIRLFTRSYKEISACTGTIYSFNTLGCIIGSFSAGFILIPLLGLKGSILLVSSLNVLIGVLYLTFILREAYLKIILSSIVTAIVFVIIAGTPEWQARYIASGAYLNRVVNIKSDYDAFFKKLETYLPVFYKEGQHSTIAVFKWKVKKGSYYSLYNNGKIEASTFFNDMRTQTMLAFLPAMLVKNSGSAAIIGMGSGITVGALLQFPFQEVEVIELEKAIVDARKYFSKPYGDPLKDQRVKLIIDDARNYLNVVDKKYDLIISEPSNVWVSGVASLFTEEYYKIIKKRLTDDGILCQWIQIYDLKMEIIASVLKAMKNEFNYVYLFHPKSGADFLLIASQKPLKIDLDNLSEKINQNKNVKNHFKNGYAIYKNYQIANLFIGNDDAITKYLSDNFHKIPSNTDNNSYLEFKAPRMFYTSPGEYFQEININELFMNLKGIDMNDVKNPTDDFYKEVVLAIKDQFKVAKKRSHHRVASDKDLYRKQALVYALKYNDFRNNSPESLSLLGKACIFSGEIKKGINYLEQAAKKNIDDISTYKILARYFNKMLYKEHYEINPEKAQKYSNKIIKLNADDPTGYLLLAIARYRLKDYTGTVNSLNIYKKLCDKQNCNFKESYYNYYIKAAKARI